jgi:hypothetical protein
VAMGTLSLVVAGNAANLAWLAPGGYRGVGKPNWVLGSEFGGSRLCFGARFVADCNLCYRPVTVIPSGFGTWVGQAAVDSDVVWAKLAAMAEGARLATRQFWGG